MTRFSPMRRPARLCAALIALSLSAAPLAAQDSAPSTDADFANAYASRVGAPDDDGKGPVTGMALPRFLSLKGDEGNARRGPSLTHRIDWVFKHRGMPLRVTAEFGHWRRVEDQDGLGGWVHYALLSGIRNVTVLEDMTPLHARADANAEVVARAESGAIARLGDCTLDWCRISAEGARGWVPKTAIWGVAADEIRD